MTYEESLVNCKEIGSGILNMKLETVFIYSDLFYNT